MQTVSSVSQLKTIARDDLPGNYSTAILAMLIVEGLYLSLLYLTSPVTGDGPFLAVLSLLMYFLLQLFMGVFASGSAYLYMNIIYRQPVHVSDIFHGFKEQPNKAIRLQLVFVLIGTVCYLPMYYYTWTAGDSYSFITRLVLMGAGYCAAFLIRLQLSQAFFLLQDFPDQSARALLSASIRLMRGNSLRLLWLTLSFLPLFIICVMTFFVPMLWLDAYYRATLAAFYRDLMAARQ